MAAQHVYCVSAQWNSGRGGLARCGSAPNVIQFSEPAGLSRLEQHWTPEQLLLCALAACFTTTFQDLARRQNFEYTDLEIEVEGRAACTKTESDLREIVIRPGLTVQSDEEFDIGLALLHRARSLCLVSRAITVPQTFEPRVERTQMPVGGWTDYSALTLGV